MSFYSKLRQIINKNQSRSVIVSGNIYDLFFDGTKYVPLVDFLKQKTFVQKSEGTRGVTQVVYEVNRPITIIGDQQELIDTWNKLRPGDDYNRLRMESFSNSMVALELLRQFTVAANTFKMKNDLIIIIEGAHMLIPTEDLARMQFADRKRLAIMHDWFSDPEFVNGTNSVLLLAESRSQLHPMISSLPQVLSVEVPFPDLETREHFIKHTSGREEGTPIDLGVQTAGLSLHALRQILCEPEITRDVINNKVEEFICAQLGEDVVEFKRPTHKLDDVMGFRKLKEFIRTELIPRCMATDDSSLSGAAIAGPIGGGKTYIMEALASELDMPVLVLKNLRSQWYGQTDVKLEKLKMVLTALVKVMMFVDEADTQFGGVGGETHETERRLTGKIQGMMSDPKLRGKVVWLLMTARIERLSPDIRRPGRAGDLIIPILDPEDEDRKEFIEWVLKDIPHQDSVGMDRFDAHTRDYSSASFAALRSRLKASKCQTLEDAVKIAEDIIPSDIASERRYQTLQALLNCTRKSLLPNGGIGKHGESLISTRSEWSRELRQLEAAKHT